MTHFDMFVVIACGLAAAVLTYLLATVAFNVSTGKRVMTTTVPMVFLTGADAGAVTAVICALAGVPHWLTALLGVCLFIVGMVAGYFLWEAIEFNAAPFVGTAGESPTDQPEASGSTEPA